MTELINFGVGGAIVIFVVKEMFQFLKGQKNGTDLKKVIENNTMVMTLIQERLHYHETGAGTRQEELKDYLKRIEEKVGK